MNTQRLHLEIRLMAFVQLLIVAIVVCSMLLLLHFVPVEIGWRFLFVLGVVALLWHLSQRYDEYQRAKSYAHGIEEFGSEFRDLQELITNEFTAKGIRVPWVRITNLKLNTGGRDREIEECIYAGAQFTYGFGRRDVLMLNGSKSPRMLEMWKVALRHEIAHRSLIQIVPYILLESVAKFSGMLVAVGLLYGSWAFLFGNNLNLALNLAVGAILFWLFYLLVRRSIDVSRSVHEIRCDLKACASVGSEAFYQAADWIGAMRRSELRLLPLDAAASSREVVLALLLGKALSLRYRFQRLVAVTGMPSIP